jgi:hypothetical protein
MLRVLTHTLPLGQTGAVVNEAMKYEKRLIELE